MEQKVMIKKKYRYKLEVGVQAGYHWSMSQSSPRPPKLILLCPRLGTGLGNSPSSWRSKSFLLQDALASGPLRFSTWRSV